MTALDTGPDRDGLPEYLSRLLDAAERGEVRAGVDPDRLVDLVGGATLLALLQTPDELAGPTWVDKTTDILLHGVVV